MEKFSEAEAVARDVIDNHSRAVNVPPAELPRLREVLLAQCIELYRIYDEGLAATFGRLNELAQREQDLLQKRSLLMEITIPVIGAMYKKNLARLRHAVANAIGAIDLTLDRVSSQIRALTESPEVKLLQQRAEKCMQPVFMDNKITEQQVLALRNPELRRLVCNGAMFRHDEPRMEFAEETGNSAIAAINRCFGVKHLHRRCRVAAPLHSIKDLHWHAMRIDLLDGARRALGVRTNSLDVLFGGSLSHQGVKMERFCIIGGDISPVPSASRGEALITIPVECIRKKNTLWRASDWPIPRAISFGEPEMLGMGGHAKSICFRTVRLENPREEIYTALIISTDKEMLKGVFREHPTCWVEPIPPVEQSMPPRDVLGTCALSVCANGGDSRRSGTGSVESEELLVELVDGNFFGMMSGPGSEICKLLLDSDKAPSWTADLAELWAPMTTRASRVKRVQIRAPRVGDLKKDAGTAEPDMEWYRHEKDAEYMIPVVNKGWTERAIATWKEILARVGCSIQSRAHLLQGKKEDLRDAVLALAEPLRWHVARIVQTMHEGVDLPPIQCAETAPSSFSRSQQLELVSASFWFHHSSCENIRTECARMLRVFHFQIGRYASASECGDGPIKTEKRKRSNNQTAWREPKKTCARTLNCDHPDARPTYTS